LRAEACASARVASALQKFLEHPEIETARKQLRSPEDRLRAFQDVDVETAEGTTVFEYFGYRK
jgi:hypothetical protein